MCVTVLLACVYVHPEHGWCPGSSPPGTEVADGCEIPCGCWDPNLDFLLKQQVLLTTKPFIQLRGEGRGDGARISTDAFWSWTGGPYPQSQLLRRLR